MLHSGQRIWFNQNDCMFLSNAKAFLFSVIVQQIADHTHIFFLLLLHKLWLHMGRLSLQQGCSKPQLIQRTPSLASHMEFLLMVSKVIWKNKKYLWNFVWLGSYFAGGNNIKCDWEDYSLIAVPNCQVTMMWHNILEDNLGLESSRSLL